MVLSLPHFSTLQKKCQPKIKQSTLKNDKKYPISNHIGIFFIHLFSYMKKTKKLLFAIAWIAITILSQKTFSQSILQFDDKYFKSEYWWNPIYTSNIAEITFNNSWDVYEWFWLFFIWTWKSLSATLTINNSSITCYKQLNWYFTTNFTDYAMFPLDSSTQSQIHDTGIDYKAWWGYCSFTKGY